MKKLLLFLLFFALSFASYQAKIVERVVARVNDDIITQSEMNSEAAGLWLELQKSYSGKQLEEEFQKKKTSLLDNLIQAKLLQQRAKELGFCSNVDQEVSAYVQNVMKDHNIKSMEEFGKILNNQGTSIESFRENISKGICVNRLIGQFVQSKITIPTEEIEKYYNEHKADFSQPEEIELSEIVFHTEGNNEKEVETLARGVLAKAKAGEGFDALAKAYSRGPTANTGGNIGSFKRGTMDPDLETLAFSLKEGEVSKDLIKTKSGFQILRVNRRKDATVAPLNEVKLKIQEAIYMKKFQPELEKFVKKLKDESYIQIYPEGNRGRIAHE